MAAVWFDDLAVIAVSDSLLGKDGEKKVRPDATFIQWFERGY